MEDRGPTDPNLDSLTMTFNLRWAKVMIYIRAKGQGQRSIGSKNKVEKTERADSITSCAAANTVNN